MDRDLGNMVVRLTNTSSKTSRDMLKTYKYMQKAKTQDRTKPGTKITKKQIEKGSHGALDPRGVGP